MTRASSAGLTVVEVTVALAVLTMLLVGVFGAMSVAMRADIAAREHRAASDAAFAQLERRLAEPDFEAVATEGADGFHVTLDVAGQGSRPKLAPAARTFFDPGPDEATMAGHVRVVRNPDRETPPSDGLIEIRVTVAWRSHDGSDRRVDVASRRSR